MRCTVGICFINFDANGVLGGSSRPLAEQDRPSRCFALCATASIGKACEIGFSGVAWLTFDFGHLISLVSIEQDHR